MSESNHGLMTVFAEALEQPDPATRAEGVAEQRRGPTPATQRRNLQRAKDLRTTSVRFPVAASCLRPGKPEREAFFRFLPPVVRETACGIRIEV